MTTEAQLLPILQAVQGIEHCISPKEEVATIDMALALLSDLRDTLVVEATQALIDVDTVDLKRPITIPTPIQPPNSEVPR